MWHAWVAVRRTYWGSAAAWVMFAKMVFVAMLCWAVVISAPQVVELLELVASAYVADPAAVIVVITVFLFVGYVFRSMGRVRWQCQTFVSGSRVVPLQPLGAAVRAGRDRASGARAERAARHEAAHAVVAAELGHLNITADIWIRGNSDGRTRHTDPNVGTLADQAFGDMMIAYAGHVVDVAGGHHDVGSVADMRMIMEMSLLILSSGQNPEKFDGAFTVEGLALGARDGAVRILAQRSEAVDGIAAHIVANGSIDDHSIRAHLVDASSS